MSTEMLGDTQTRPEATTADGEHEMFSHYVRKEDIYLATVEGKAVRALCGKEWVPIRDPQRFPVCPECRRAWEALG